MFVTGIVIGSVLGSATCLVAVLLPALAGQTRRRAQLRPALVPVQVSRPTRMSMN